MNENLDLTKILEGCPVGTEFYSSVFGECYFIGITNNEDYPIKIEVYSERNKLRSSALVTRDGRHRAIYDGECTLFPLKDQRDWSKFERFWYKPKADKFDPNTLQPFDKVLARGIDDSWKALTFSHKSRESYYAPWCCDGFFYDYCIPYNDETKHLIGTKEDCLEYYKWWEE